jgi:hypothetical protein
VYSDPPDRCLSSSFDAANLPAGAKANIWYAGPEADALAGEDLDPGNADIQSQFNGALGQPGCIEGSKWYMGLDHKVPDGQIDFLNVVLHEMSHGLGFLDLTDLQTGEDFPGDAGSHPNIYGSFVKHDGTLWDDLTPAQRVTAAWMMATWHSPVRRWSLKPRSR